MKSPSKSTTRTSGEVQQNVPERVHEFIAELHHLVAEHALKWHEPTVSHNEDDSTFDVSWWREKKSLIATIEADGAITLLKVWGPHIYNEMDEVENPTEDQLVDLWQWLYA
jgi:hypothetical protein